MRPDVKLGVAISFILVVVAGGYYLYRDSREVSIPVSGKTADLASLQGASNLDANSPKSQAGKTRKDEKSARSNSRPKQSKPVSARKGDRRVADSGQSAMKRARHENQSGRRSADQNGGNARESSASGNGRKPKGVNRPSSTPVNTVGTDAARNKSGQNPAESPNSATLKSATANASKRKGPSTRGDGGTQTTKRTRSDRGQRSPRGSQAVSGNGSALDKRAAGSGSRAGRNRSGPSKHARSSPTIAIETHRLQPGDTLAGLAVSYYGSERHVGLLLDANPQIRNPDRLQVGAVVKIPPAPRGDRTAPAAVHEDSTVPTGTQRTYTVQSGDSFYAIAQSQLGEASRWSELFELNKALVKGDPKRLQIGQVITLPN
ncbi:MAG: LysM peptidoglycan-binding domain-containing protein [Planctomycetes bacterium]|nr:LysM peptidoglycan-binding domain-containing protein [Planctomycetota bacterium]